VSARGTPELSRLSGDVERRAASRSGCYGLFAAALEYPDEPLCRAVREGEISSGLRRALADVAPELAVEPYAEALHDASSEDELAVEYTRLFDAAAGAAPCPLYDGAYAGDRMRVMEEAVRFYNYFGLKLSDTAGELPDHLSTELEFLHYLGYREAEASQRGADPAPFQRAQRDFLARHPARWIPEVCRRLESNQAAPYFAALFALLGRFLERDLAELVARLGPPTGADVPRAES